MPADLPSQIIVLGVVAPGFIRFDPTFRLLESNELRGKSLPVSEDGRQMACEVTDVAREDLLALGVQYVCGLHPG